MTYMTRRDPNGRPQLPGGPPVPQPARPPAAAQRNPGAAAYQAELDRRRMNQAPAGGRPPPIPPLDAPIENGAPASVQAAALRQDASRRAAATGANPGFFVPPEGSPAPAGRTPPRRMSPQGAEAFRELEELQRQQQEAAEAEQQARVDDVAETSTLNEAENLVGPPKTEVSELTEALKNLDEFDEYTLRQALMRDIINNDDQRALIESRLKPLSIGQLLTNNHVKQVIPIDPDDFVIELKSLSVEEEQAIKRLAVHSKLEAPDAPLPYHKERFSIMGVTAALVRINNKAYGEAVINGKWDDDAFWKKFNMVVKLPYDVVSCIALHAFWFGMRVRALTQVKNLKNG